MNKKTHKETQENCQEIDNKNLNKDTDVNTESVSQETGTESQPKSVADTVQEMGEKLAELDDKYKRLYAEFDNYRRRTAKEKTDLIIYAAESTIKDLLPVIDDYERALTDMDTADDIPDERKEGIRLIYNKLMGVLDKKGVKPMESKGKQFDENLHEAVSHLPITEGTEKGQIIDEVQKGYFMNEKVIRFAKVVVAM